MPAFNPTERDDGTLQGPHSAAALLLLDPDVESFQCQEAFLVVLLGPAIGDGRH